VKLTVKRVAKLLRRGTPGRYFDAQGLYLVVESKKNASWSRRYELHHKPHEIGLGSAFTFSLHEARERNRAISQQLTDKIDPLAAKRAQHATQAAAAVSKTFKQCAEGDGTEDFKGYIKDHQAKWRSSSHGAQWRSSLERFVYPKIGALDVREIARPHVLSVLEQHVAGERGPAGKFWEVRTVTANRVRSRMELILGWAAGRGYRSGDNPARWDDLQHILPAPTKLAKVEHHKAVPYDELPELMAQIRNREGTAAQALRFLTLTATRASETLLAIWDEIDLTKKIWTIPAERMKGGKEHKVPLSPQAIELLKSLYTEDNNKLLFIGPRGGEALSSSSLQRVMQRLKRTEVPHGMRSSFSDWAHEQTSHGNHTIELSLAHSIGTKVEQSYRRGDLLEKRRKLMEAWGKYCTSAAPARRRAADKNVFPIGAAR
jgi:integrase